MRVLVTGSRTWRRGTLVHEKLRECRATCVASGDVLTVVHGGCLSGADYFANAWARWHSDNATHVARPEVHPARWDAPCGPKCRPGHRLPPTPQTISSRTDLSPGWDVCPRAGMYRNELMVELGADLVLAFIADYSRGATGCAWIAERAGLRVVRFTAVVNGPAELPFMSA